MLKIRPHHILCFYGWRGRGYDDVFTENETEQRQLNVFIAITLAEQSLLITHPQLLSSLVEKKVRKVLNLIAKKHNLAEI